MATAGPALVFEAAERGSVVMAQLVGVINEDNSLEERLTSTRGKGVLIDLASVERINSCGVRDWIRFAQRLEAAGNALYLFRCSPVVVAQINMVRNFCGDKGQVVSFQAPYFCPNCDEERTETFPSEKMSQGTSPSATCPTCKGPMEFDDLPDLYFAFTRLHAARVVPPEIQAAMEVLKGGLPPGARIGGTPVPPTPRPSASSPALPVAKPVTAATVARPGIPAVPAKATSRSNPALAGLPAPAAATTTRPSNPALAARPAAPPAPVAPAVPHPGSSAPTPLQAGTAASTRRPSQPSLPPIAGSGTGIPTARPSGPKPVARPLMGGSPFPTARASGPKVGPAGPAGPVPATTPGGDPTKK